MWHVFLDKVHHLRIAFPLVFTYTLYGAYEKLHKYLLAHVQIELQFFLYTYQINIWVLCKHSGFLIFQILKRDAIITGLKPKTFDEFKIPTEIVSSPSNANKNVDTKKYNNYLSTNLLFEESAILILYK